MSDLVLNFFESDGTTPVTWTFDETTSQNASEKTFICYPDEADIRKKIFMRIVPSTTKTGTVKLFCSITGPSGDYGTFSFNTIQKSTDSDPVTLESQIQLIHALIAFISDSKLAIAKQIDPV